LEVLLNNQIQFCLIFSLTNGEKKILIGQNIIQKLLNILKKFGILIEKESKEIIIISNEQEVKEQVKE
jgi:hypothetical protein